MVIDWQIAVVGNLDNCQVQVVTRVTITKVIAIIDTGIMLIVIIMASIIATIATVSIADSTSVASARPIMAACIVVMVAIDFDPTSIAL